MIVRQNFTICALVIINKMRYNNNIAVLRRKGIKYGKYQSTND